MASCTHGGSAQSVAHRKAPCTGVHLAGALNAKHEGVVLELHATLARALEFGMQQAALQLGLPAYTKLLLASSCISHCSCHFGYHSNEQTIGHLLHLIVQLALFPRPESEDVALQANVVESSEVSLQCNLEPLRVDSLTQTEGEWLEVVEPPHVSAPVKKVVPAIPAPVNGEWQEMATKGVRIGGGYHLLSEPPTCHRSQSPDHRSQSPRRTSRSPAGPRSARVGTQEWRDRMAKQHGMTVSDHVVSHSGETMSHGPGTPRITGTFRSNAGQNFTPPYPHGVAQEQSETAWATSPDIAAGQASRRRLSRGHSVPATASRAEHSKAAQWHTAEVTDLAGRVMNQSQSLTDIASLTRSIDQDVDVRDWPAPQYSQPLDSANGVGTYDQFLHGAPNQATPQSRFAVGAYSGPGNGQQRTLTTMEIKEAIRSGSCQLYRVLKAEMPPSSPQQVQQGPWRRKSGRTS